MKYFLEGFIETLKSLIGAAVCLFLVINFVIFPCSVQGTSMLPNLEDGQRGFSFIVCKINGIQRFSTVVINNEKNNNLLVKRVIGLPNDTIEYKDNCLYINGEQYDEYYLSDNVTTEDLSITLGEDEYYCLGDNRNISRDSRYYGPFNLDDIKCEHAFIYYPFKDFGYRQ